MPSIRVTPVQRALLVQMADGSVICGTLGKDPLSPNHRIFETSAGQVIERNTAVSLLRRGMLKIISVDGPRNYLTITELGRLAVAVQGRRVKAPHADETWMRTGTRFEKDA